MVAGSGTGDPVVDGKYLENVQGDIWSKGFPKYFETYYFFTIKDGQAKAFSQNLRKLVDVKPPLISNLDKVKKDWDIIAKTPKGTVHVVANALIAFTFPGLKVIQKGFNDSETLQLVNVQACDPAFCNGMAADSILNDPDRKQWDPLFQEKSKDEEIHGLLKVAGSSEAEISKKLAEVQKVLGLGTIILNVKDGKSEPTKEASRMDGRTRSGDDAGKEHFGFEDAISQPLMKGIDKIPEKFNFTSMATNPATLIVASNTTSESTDERQTRPKWMYGGSFLVCRKLEQDVKNFNKTIKDWSLKWKLEEDHVKAKLMGRWPSGAPIAMPEFYTKDAKDKSAAKLLNDFKYEEGLHVCPASAHIRKTNPRGSIKISNDHFRCAATNMIRHGIPYGQVGDPKVGLLFACYQAHIEDSFQEMQGNWCNGADFPEGGAGLDPFIGQGSAKDGQVQTTTNNLETASKQTPASAKGLEFAQFVTMKGGDYFFVPSIPALRDSLGQA